MRVSDIIGLLPDSEQICLCDLPLFSSTWVEIARMSFILLVFIAIYVCRWDLGGSAREAMSSPGGTRIVFPPYPALRLPTPMRAKAARIGDPVRLRAGLSYPRPQWGWTSSSLYHHRKPNLSSHTDSKDRIYKDIGFFRNLLERTSDLLP